MEFGRIYKICEIKNTNNFMKIHLKNLGFEIGENIQLLKYNYKKLGFMVKVMGVNFVVDKKVAEMIYVYELWNNFGGKSKHRKNNFV